MSDLKSRVQRAVAEKDPSLAPIFSTLGLELVDMKDREARIAMEAGINFANPMGTIHGGILATLADTAMGLAFITTLDQGDSFTTVDLTVKYMRPFFPARVSAKGWVVKRGKNLGLCQSEVLDQEGNLLAVAYSSCMALRGEAAEGR